MKKSASPTWPLRAVLLAATLAAAPLFALTLSGCLVAGYSSNGGAFIWPGGFGLLFLLVIVFLLLRRRR